MAALPAFAEPEDLADWLGIEFTEDESGRVAMVLRMASSRIRSYVGKTFVDDEGNLADPLPEALTLTAITVAGRAWDNPTGELQATAGATTVIHGQGGDSLDLTDSEKDMLNDPEIVGTTAVLGIGTITTTRGDNIDGTHYANVVNGEPIPMYDGDGLGYGRLI